FRIIATSERYYSADFHKMTFRDGSSGYRILLQALGENGFVVDVLSITPQKWYIVGKEQPIPSELEAKLTEAIVSEEGSTH
ncbi:MAG: hypothetical protein K8F24_10620, partial [Bacteroidales bacterium]|nr:hypothetical protein [Bacteroidales bacterium]